MDRTSRAPHTAHTRHRLAGLAAMIAIAVCVSGLWSTESPVRAATCTTGRGQPLKVLETDNLSFRETQACINGEWVRVQLERFASDETLSIKETVEEPRDDRFRFATAADFFDLKSYDPYAIVKEMEKLLDGTLELAEDERTELKLMVAAAKSQGIIHRNATLTNDGCRMRSRLYARTDVQSGDDWLGPRSVTPPGTPKTIDYVIDPSVGEDQQVAIYSALLQYPLAVVYQDAEFRYPEQIVPHDPASTLPPTITFKASPLGPVDTSPAATTKMTAHYSSGPDGKTRTWAGGEIWLGQRSDGTGQSPAVVGHEIGHVLGIDHPAMENEEIISTMSWAVQAGKWTVEASDGNRNSVAFDECMFLPPEQPN